MARPSSVFEEREEASLHYLLAGMNTGMNDVHGWTVKRDGPKTFLYSGGRDFLADKADRDESSVTSPSSAFLFSEQSSESGDFPNSSSLDHGYEHSSIPSENMSRLARKNVNRKSLSKSPRDALTLNKLNTSKLELVGRDGHLLILRNAFDQAREGKASIVTIMGEFECIHVVLSAGR
jgi:hypothetical protein